MAAVKALREVLRVTEEIERVKDFLCGLKAPVPATILEDLKLPKECGAILVPARIFTGPRHLKLVAYLTELAFSEGSAIARKKEVEFMLNYLATRQIREALKEFNPGGGDAVLYVWCAGNGGRVPEIGGCLPPPEPDPSTELEMIGRTALFWAEQHR